MASTRDHDLTVVQMRNSTEFRELRRSRSKDTGEPFDRVPPINRYLSMVMVTGTSPTAAPLDLPGHELSPVRWRNGDVNGVFLGKSGWVQVKRNCPSLTQQARTTPKECREGVSAKAQPDRPGSLDCRGGLAAVGGEYATLTPIISPPAAFRDKERQEEGVGFFTTVQGGRSELNSVGYDTGSRGRGEGHRDRVTVTVRRGEFGCRPPEKAAGTDWPKTIVNINSNNLRSPGSLYSHSHSRSYSTSSSSSSSPSLSPPPSLNLDPIPNSSMLLERKPNCNRTEESTHNGYEGFFPVKSERLNMKRSKSFQVTGGEESSSLGKSFQRGENGKAPSRNFRLNLASCDEINQRFSESGGWEVQRREFLREAAKEVQIVTDFMNGRRSRAAARDLLYHRYANRPEGEAVELDADSRLGPKYGVHFLGPDNRIAPDGPCTPKVIDREILTTDSSFSSSSSVSSSSSGSPVHGVPFGSSGNRKSTCDTCGDKRFRRQKKMKRLPFFNGQFGTTESSSKCLCDVSFGRNRIRSPGEEYLGVGGPGKPDRPTARLSSPNKADSFDGKGNKHGLEANSLWNTVERRNGKGKRSASSEDERLKRVHGVLDENLELEGPALSGGPRWFPPGQVPSLDVRRRSSSLPKCFRSENPLEDHRHRPFLQRIHSKEEKNFSDVPVYEYATKTAMCVGNGRHSFGQEPGNGTTFWRQKLESPKRLNSTRRLDSSRMVPETALHRFKKIVLTKLKGKGNESGNDAKSHNETFPRHRHDSRETPTDRRKPSDGERGKENWYATRRNKSRSAAGKDRGDPSPTTSRTSRCLGEKSHVSEVETRGVSPGKPKLSISHETFEMKSGTLEWSPGYFSDGETYSRGKSQAASRRENCLVSFYSLDDLKQPGKPELFPSSSDPGIKSLGDHPATNSTHVLNEPNSPLTSEGEDCDGCTSEEDLLDGEPSSNSLLPSNVLYVEGKNVSGGGKKGERVLAEVLWNHVAAKQNELSLTAGDVLEVVEATDRNWWWGTLGTSCGYFPSTCVRLVVEEGGRATGEGVPSFGCGMKSWEGGVEPEANLPALSKDEIRSNVVRELLNTERDYVNGLSNVAQGYIEHCKKRTDMFTESQIDSIFSNMEEVLRFQKKFLADLEERVDAEHPHKSCIGETFMIHKRGFQVYSEYCNSHPVAMATLQELYKKREYERFFKDCGSRKDFMKIPLDGYLLTPIQRICKYPLQLGELLKHTKGEHPDHGPVREALETMKAVAMSINEKKRKMENLEKLFAWQWQVEGWEGEDLTALSCQLIHQGEVRAVKANAGVWTSNLSLFLFDRQLIYCKKDLLKRNVLIYKGRILLDGASVLDVTDGKNQVMGGTIKHGIHIVNEVEDQWVLFSCRSEGEKMKWMEALTEERKFVTRELDAGLELSPAARDLARISAGSKTLRHKPKKKIFK